MAVNLDKSLMGSNSAGLTTGIDKLSELIKTSIDTARKPASDLAPFLTTIEGMMRPGMSAISLTANIVSRLGEAGINTGTLPDGSEPQITKVVRIFCEEWIKEVQLNMKVMTEIRPGTQVGMAGPVPVVSALPIQGVGIPL